MSARNKEAKPRLLLSCTLHAPKVAVADEAGRTTLLADLGCFTLESAPQLAALLNAEESALYECFVMRVDHVSAYLLDGPFQWPSGSAGGERAVGGRTKPEQFVAFTNFCLFLAAFDVINIAAAASKVSAGCRP